MRTIGKKGSPKDPTPRYCGFPGCGRLHKSNGWCEAHRDQEKRHGAPVALVGQSVPLPRKAPSEYVLSYRNVHKLLARWRGKAAQHACSECGETAAEWAFQGHAESRIGKNGGVTMLYSEDLSAFKPMCRPCHRSMDNRKGR